MKRLAGICIAGAFAALGMTSAANAGAITEACYQKSYVAAKYAYGKKLIKDEYRTWTNLDNGPGLVTRERHPAVFLETSRKVSHDHYILRPVPCP